MKRCFLLMATLIILSGCAFGVYDGRGFEGVVVGPHSYHAPSYYDRHYDGYYYKHGNRYYSYEPDRYYRGYDYPKYYR